MIKQALDKTKDWLEKSQALPKGQEVSARQAQQLESYLDLLILWSKRVDLVALASRGELVDRHIVDSYAAYLLISSKVGEFESCLDVGTGAGLPGLVFAILEPGSKFYLCEPREKRQIFLREAIQGLGLSNAQVLGLRLEELKGESRYNFICSRALGMEESFDKYSRPLLAKDGTICQLLGPSWEQGGRPKPATIVNYSLFNSGPERKLVFWD